MQVGQVVSHTTRDPRDAEANGTHYHFVTKQQFQNMIRQGDFVEYDNIHGRCVAVWDKLAGRRESGRAQCSEGV